ncbi:SpoIIE family protein phosphatase [Streptomyces sp. NPDC058534]|uniref:SpoIIE family protein phosphatase n=1 Tax=Streptomyces sp. NPDC058534 TaxID=3346541 RepID=UPI003653C3AB
MFVVQVVLGFLLIVAVTVALVFQAHRDAERDAVGRSLAVAQTVATSRWIVKSLKSDDPTALLQPRAEETRKVTGVDFVVVANTDGIRYTHPLPELIGTRMAADFRTALKGQVVRETVRTPQGDSVQVVVPVSDREGKVVGVVSAGVSIDHLDGMVAERLPVLLWGAVGVLALSAGGTALVSRRLRWQTRRLGPTALTRMYEHHDAVLHAVREGVLVVRGDGRLLLANDEARRLLDLPVYAEQRQVTDLGLEPRTAGLLASGRAATDEVVFVGDRLLAVNQRPIAPYGGQPGSVATLRDTTELRALSGRAEVARERLGLLYDAGLRLGASLDVVHIAEELSRLAVPRFADHLTVELVDGVLRGEEPPGSSTVMRRVAARGVRADQPPLPVGELIDFAVGTAQARAVESGRAELDTDPDVSSGFLARDPDRSRRSLDNDIHSLIAVPLRARGVVLGLVDFWRADGSEAFGEEDVHFAEELAARAALAVDNARRYTREHAMAVTLQRSLLPHDLPEQSSLDFAYRYLPAQAGVGGDWFDVIPLPGTRVALVVGDVVGHGLHAAATMGRLRTAVHNFSSLDLPPDELLSHLDELVARIDADKGTEPDEAHGGLAVTGATCLYAVYDPVNGACTLARAGHPGPALIRPDGTVDYPAVPVSPPLGLGGGTPFEAAELCLEEGSRLVLFTDGLVTGRGRDLDTGLETLRTALAAARGRTPEETCAVVLENVVMPGRPGDDIALLVARTRRLDPVNVAAWEVPSDPAAVAPIRAACSRRLEAWGLDEIAFATEMILSELITNAIRHGTQPITVRMLYDRTLICEVSDGSSTSPHLRRAATTDEGGRGLFLVAQFARRWGTRYLPRGKVIWSEQALHNGAAEPDADLGDILLGQWDDTAGP